MNLTRNCAIALLAIGAVLSSGFLRAADAPVQPKIAAHFLVPETAEIAISATKAATDPRGRAVQVACGLVTVRRDANNFSTSSFVYVIDDDVLWLTWKAEEWLKEPQKMGVVQVMRYCGERKPA